MHVGGGNGDDEHGYRGEAPRERRSFALARTTFAWPVLVMCALLLQLVVPFFAVPTHFEIRCDVAPSCGVHATSTIGPWIDKSVQWATQTKTDRGWTLAGPSLHDTSRWSAAYTADGQRFVDEALATYAKDPHDGFVARADVKHDAVTYGMAAAFLVLEALVIAAAFAFWRVRAETDGITTTLAVRRWPRRWHSHQLVDHELLGIRWQTVTTPGAKGVPLESLSITVVTTNRLPFELFGGRVPSTKEAFAIAEALDDWIGKTPHETPAERERRRHDTRLFTSFRRGFRWFPTLFFTVVGLLACAPVAVAPAHVTVRCEAVPHCVIEGTSILGIATEKAVVWSLQRQSDAGTWMLSDARLYASNPPEPFDLPLTDAGQAFVEQTMRAYAAAPQDGFVASGDFPGYLYIIFGGIVLAAIFAIRLASFPSWRIRAESDGVSLVIATRIWPWSETKRAFDDAAVTGVRSTRIAVGLGVQTSIAVTRTDGPSFELFGKRLGSAKAPREMAEAFAAWLAQRRRA